MEFLPADLQSVVQELEEQFTVPTEKLKAITSHFIAELDKGLSVEGGSIPMNPTWVMDFPNGHETGTYLALDMGGTNLRVCQVTLTDKMSEFDVVQSKYRIPEEIKTGDGPELWEYLADCVHQFVETHCEPEPNKKFPLGFTFSYPATQDYIDHGILQRWTKGFDISGVEGHNVVPMMESALQKRKTPVVVAALINDTTGTLIASAYTDSKMKVGCIFGTGCNAAYMENCGSIPKLAHMNLPPDTPMAINCEWGAFDNEHVVLPRTKYDVTIDDESPRRGQQAFEKMIAGLYLGEIWRLVMLELHERGIVFRGQNGESLKKAYSLDSAFLSALEEDLTDDLAETKTNVQKELGLSTDKGERIVMKRLAQLIGTRAARLSACGVAAICKKKSWDSCHVGADGSVFQKYPHFKPRGAQALREILDWPEKKDAQDEDPIEILPAEDGSGVGAALIAALTHQRVNAGNKAGVLHPEHYL